ncbi:MAG: hypothetical protein ABSB74_05490 [Tepidisphaeraceae bacterium]
MFKVDVSPLQPQMFGRAAKPAVAAQGKQQSPLCIGAGFNHLVGHIAPNEEHPGLVRLASHFQIRERAFDDHLPRLDGPAENLLGGLRPLGNRRTGQLGVVQALPPLLSHHRGNVADRRRFPEIVNQAVSGLLVGGACAGLRFQRREKLIVQLSQRDDGFRLPGLSQPHGHKPGVHRVGQARQPSARFVVNRAAGYQAADQ